MLCLTIHSSTFVTNNSVVTAERIVDEYGDFDLDVDLNDPAFGGSGYHQTRERQTVITQDIPVKVLHPQDVGGLHEPRLREPDVHIYMPNLAQLKSMSDRFTKLALATSVSNSAKNTPKLEMSANMHGSLKLAIKTDALSITSQWTNLLNPDLDASQFEGGSQAVRDHPSTRMRELGGPDGSDEAGWAKVRIDAKDWSRVLSVGRVSSRVVGCLLDDTALVMYCWIGGPDDEEESCLTVRKPKSLVVNTNIMAVLYNKFQPLVRRLHPLEETAFVCRARLISRSWWRMRDMKTMFELVISI